MENSGLTIKDWLTLFLAAGVPTVAAIVRMWAVQNQHKQDIQTQKEEHAYLKGKFEQSQHDAAQGDLKDAEWRGTITEKLKNLETGLGQLLGRRSGD